MDGGDGARVSLSFPFLNRTSSIWLYRDHEIPCFKAHARMAPHVQRYFFGATPVNEGHITFQYLATFVALISQVLQGIMGIFGVFPQLMAAIGAATKLVEPLLLCPSVKDMHRKGRILETLSGDLTMENVKFAYPSKPDLEVFSSFDFRVPMGRSIAIVGGSGSGTLA